ncbi:sulfate adenylyltransferase subunit CysN [Pseudidiomarina planktonica]|nr:sulfate adenylyltransferase subunit CysN [Pseudidiomarina planktonica]RUO65921.1 bifunctional sulfate adenylyltransferase subunit 1/adenylylsulfate kinase [Pseudidiomarina planktonica]
MSDEAMSTNPNKLGLLRLLTCGSVDDGKSTLIGRLLYDSQGIYEDQLSSLTADSKKMGTQGGELDLALLVDGLQSEREQGITIDVAYRYFSTPKRKFIIADTPGHEQYTRNMATGASNSDFAIILIDASKGVQTQTRRHSFICSLLGIKQVIVAVNKMDTVGYKQDVYKGIQQDYLKLAGSLDIPDIRFVPISALLGDNVVHPSKQMPWFRGSTLLHYIETTVPQAHESNEFRFPVQRVSRPDSDFRGFEGSIVSGAVKVGDTIRVLPAGTISSVRSITTFDGELDQAVAPQAVTITLNDEVAVNRGDMLAHKDDLPRVASRVRAKLVWMHEQPLQPRNEYRVHFITKATRGMVAGLHHRIDVNTMTEQSVSTLGLNEIGLVDLQLVEPVPFDKYADNKHSGSFILIDKVSNTTVAAGMVEEALPDTGAQRAGETSQEVVWHAAAVGSQERALRYEHKPCMLWYTGLSGSGKSTIANAVDRLLFERGCRTYVLDGDNLRHGLNKDLGFSDSDRVENIRRVSEMGRLFVDAGLIVSAALISPFAEERARAKTLVGADQFIEVFIDTPIEVCEQRDPKGLYAKARAGDIPNFTGISSPYEAPAKPDVHVHTDKVNVTEAAQQIIDYLFRRRIIA